MIEIAQLTVTADFGHITRVNKNILSSAMALIEMDYSQAVVTSRRRVDVNYFYIPTTNNAGHKKLANKTPHLASFQWNDACCACR